MACRGSIFEALGVRRYGFHGTSTVMCPSAPWRCSGLPEQDSGLVIAHLGNGASICAVRNNRKRGHLDGDDAAGGADDGHPLWRCGFWRHGVDCRETRQTLSDLERVVNTASRPAGDLGLSSDLRVLEKAWHGGHPPGPAWRSTFVHRIARHIAGHAASLHRLDGIIFTGGIGENSVLIRRLVSGAADGLRHPRWTPPAMPCRIRPASA